MIALAALRNVVDPALQYRTPAIVRERYRYLYDERVKPTPDGGAEFHFARLWRREGLNVLHLRGDRFEMAFQHGALLAKEIADGALKMASLLQRNAIRNSVGGALAKVVTWYAETGIAETMLRRGLELARARGDDVLPEAFGLSEACGVPVRTIVRAALAAECSQTLLGKTGKLAVGGDPSCTDFAAWGSATRDGELLIGRNTDYPLTGYFDAHPTVIYFEPTDGGQRYMTITGAGAHNAGVVGLNEAGIYLGLHTVPAGTTSEQGAPIFFIGQSVLREAEDLEQVERMLRGVRPAAGWQYHAVDTVNRRAVTFELCCAAVGAREAEGDFHVTTNHWTQPEMQPHHLTVNATVETDTRARYDRCVELIEAAGGDLDVAGAAAILGDKYDRVSGRVRATPNVVSAVHNVTSAVFAPDRGKVYVANGTAPVSQNTYVEVPSIGAFDRDRFAGAGYATIDNGHYRADHAAMLDAEQKYNEARAAFEYDNDAGAAADLCAEALAIDGSNPAMHLSHAMFCLRAGRFADADDAARAVIALGWDPPRQRVARYLRARIAAHRGRADEALRALREVAGDADAEPRLRAAASAAARKLRRRGRLRLGAGDVAPMSWLPDAYRYSGLF